MSRKQKILCIILAAVGVLLLIASAVIRITNHYYAMMDTDPSYEPKDIDYTPLPALTDATPEPTLTPDPNDPLASQNIYTVLLLGSDDRLNSLNSRTDTMMAITINKSTQQIILTSFLRDTYVYISGWGYERLNVANEVGGPDVLENTLSDNFGAAADNYAFVNFYTFMDVIDALGGIDLSLSDMEVYYINVWVWDEDLQLDYSLRHSLDYREDGVYHLDGCQALAYCRTRDLGSDLTRTQQQRRVVEEVWDKLRSMDLSELTDLLSLVLPQVTTDISEETCISLLATMLNYKNFEIVQQQIPADGTFTYAYIGDMNVISPNINLNRSIFYKTIHGVADN